MEKKQENKGLIRDIPILRASDQSCETSWSIQYLLEDMSIGTVPIPEERAGDYGSVSEWRGCIEIHVIKHSIDQEFHRFEIGIRHVPKGASFKYMTDPSARESDSLWINPIEIDMQRDIAKDERAQLIAFIYYAQKKKAEEPRLFEDMKKELASLHFSIDSVTIEEEDEEFEGWLDTVGCNLATAYLNGKITLSMITHGDLYLVYGEFDPATRKNLLDKPIQIPEPEK